jgi:CRP-like cAMP-binding protein
MGRDAVLGPVTPAAALLKTAIFRDVPREAIEELVPHLCRLSFARGEVVWREGDLATALYVIQEGQLKSFRVSRDGSEVILEVESSGDVTGEVGLFHPGGVRLVNVSAMEPTVCVTIARDPLLAFMTRHPPVMRRMLESLSELAGRAGYSVTDLAFNDIRKRVALTLLDLARVHGEPHASAVRIRLKLSHATLASMVAASRENVNRALASFQVRGHVSHQGGYFFVHDREALERVAL